MLNKGYDEADSFLHRVGTEVVTFVVLALEGIEVPGHTVVVNRLMGGAQVVQAVGDDMVHEGESSAPYDTRGAHSRAGNARTFWEEKLYEDAAVFENRGFESFDWAWQASHLCYTTNLWSLKARARESSG